VSGAPVTTGGTRQSTAALSSLGASPTLLQGSGVCYPCRRAKVGVARTVKYGIICCWEPSHGLAELFGCPFAHAWFIGI